MTLPKDANERIARADAWLEMDDDRSGKWYNRRNGHWSNVLPKYTTSLDAVEPVFQKLCPGSSIHFPSHPKADEACEIDTLAVHKGGHWYRADTLAEAMCAAVLAAIEAGAKP